MCAQVRGHSPAFPSENIKSSQEKGSSCQGRLCKQTPERAALILPPQAENTRRWEAWSVGIARWSYIKTTTKQKPHAIQRGLFVSSGYIAAVPPAGTLTPHDFAKPEQDEHFLCILF